MTFYPKPRLSAVVLAAGFSSRMGSLKALLPLGPHSAIERVINLFHQNNVQDVVVVTGYSGEKLSHHLKTAGVRTVHNPDYESGMFSSVQTGVRGIAKGSDGFFLQPVDIPLVRPYTIDLLRQVSACNPGRLVHPRFAGKRGHPPLIPAAVIPEILSWGGDGGLRGCLARHDACALSVDTPDRFILADMDTPDDYRRLLAENSRWDIPDAAECELMLRTLFPVSPEVLHHSRRVAEVAHGLGTAVHLAGHELDLALIWAAAMLHDIAKGHRRHATVGGAWLAQLGLCRIAAVVSAHTDPEPIEAGSLTEKQIVYLADKLVRQDKRVTLEERFEAALSRYGRDPAACENIIRRRQAARQAVHWIEQATGRSLEEILGHAASARYPAGGGK